MLKLDDMLEADAYWCAEYLSSPSRGFSIPPYQREYSWDESGHLEPLIADICRNIDMLRTAEDRTMFIGTIITIADDRLRKDLTKKGGGGSNIPGTVHTVVDGQQRLTTMTLLTSALHHRLSLSKLSISAVPQWLSDQVDDTIIWLADTFMFWVGSNRSPYRALPRITREIGDVWSRDPSVANYESPIGSLLADYIRYAETSGHLTPFDPACDPPGGGSITPRELIRSRWKFFDNMASGLSFTGIGTPPDYLDDFPSVETLLDSKTLQESLYEERIDSATRKAIAGDAEVQQLFGLEVFARFVCRRITAGVISTSDDTAAFDMFEALNTTGELLTAIETLRPHVVMNTSDYPSSPERVTLDQVSSWLDAITSAQTKQTESTRLVISTLVAETGRKIGGHLSEQRLRLSGTYTDLVKQGDGFELVETLGDVAQFTNDLWTSDPISTIGRRKLGDSLRLSIKVLVDANHDVTKAVLSRYYADARRDPATGLPELEAAANAVAAFFALWRGFYGATKGIDGVHRQWMTSAGSRRYEQPKKKGLLGRQTPPAAELKRYLCEQLDTNRIDRAAFVTTASAVPVYRHSQPLARLLSLAAMHDSICDEKNPGQITRGKKNSSTQLTFNRWVDDEAFSVEHIAPQQATNQWVKELYVNPSTVHRLGNLVLLPSPVNSSLGNIAWKSKRLAFRWLGAQGPSEQQAIQKAAKAARVKIPKNIESNAAYHVLLACLGEYPGPWEVDAISMRSQVLAGRAWDNLRTWLD